MTDAAPDLFVGQMIALIPEGVVGRAPGMITDALLAWLFPRPAPGEGASAARRRRADYTVTLRRGRHGVLTVDDVEIEVDVIPLDEQPPDDTPVFRISGIEGQRLHVTGTVSREPPAP